MSNVRVFARFRPLSSKERRDHGDTVCIHGIDSQSFIFKDEKDEESTFNFDRVFYENSTQASVYEFLAQNIIRDVANGKNGTIITYGQTGAGKTYSMEGPTFLECDELKKGLLARVVDGLFEHINSSNETLKYTIKLSMVEIYMEKVRDLFDLAKDNMQIKETRTQEILLSGVTEMLITDPAKALQSLSSGIANRAVSETHINNLDMNMASSRSHCVYIFLVQQESSRDKRVKTGKLILVDLAGSEKVEKTGAEGRVLEEAKMINKSLSALGNVINALTCGSPGKANHVPYRDSKLTRLLQDALGGNSHTALLCCCSPSTSNASESMSTLRFGTRAKHIKALPCIIEEKISKIQRAPLTTTDESCERILKKLRSKLKAEDVELLEELFIREGIFFDFNSLEETESAYDDVITRTISSLHQVVDELLATVDKLTSENNDLKVRVKAAEGTAERPGLLNNIFQALTFFLPRFAIFSS